MMYRLAQSATRPTIATIDLNAFKRNLRVLKKHAQSEYFLAVVKTNAYGHGIVPVARAAVEAGVDWLGITTLEEGITLREHGIDVPLLLLSDSFISQVPDIVAYDLTASISSLPLAEQLSSEASRQNRQIPIHLKIDTGLHRFGITPQEAIAFCESCYHLPGLYWQGVFTHFSDADEGNWQKTNEQYALFEEVVMLLERNAFTFPMRHVAGSTITIERPDMHLHMVRPGIALYGYDPSPSQKTILPLTPVMQLTTNILSIKHVPTNTSVGYGGNYLTRKNEKLAILPIGLGDGFSRKLSNQGYVLVDGQRANIVGNISLDQTTIDVTHIPGVKAGDPVVIIGEMGDEVITAEEIASWMGSIVDEVLACFTERIPRRYA